MRKKVGERVQARDAFIFNSLLWYVIGLDFSLSLSLSLSLPPSVFFLNLTLSIPSASSFFLLVIPTTQSVDNPAVVVHVFSSSSSFFFLFCDFILRPGLGRVFICGSTTTSFGEVKWLCVRVCVYDMCLHSLWSLMYAVPLCTCCSICALYVCSFDLSPSHSLSYRVWMPVHTCVTKLICE